MTSTTSPSPTHRRRFNLPACAVLLLLSCLATLSEARTIALIRHGEKPAVGNDLSAAGRVRSECIINVFNKGPLKPSYIFAQEPDPKPDGYHEIRSLQTCQPLANALGLPAVAANKGNLATLSSNVDISVDRDHVDKLAAAITAVQPPNGTVLVCWEHDTLPLIARSLGVASLVPQWSSADFDSIWVIDTETRSFNIQSQGCGSPSSAPRVPITALPLLSTMMLMVIALFSY